LSFIFNPKNDSERPPDDPPRIRSVEISASDVVTNWSADAETRGTDDDIVEPLKGLSEQISDCEAFGLVYKKSLENDEDDEMQVLSLIATSFEEVPVDDKNANACVLQDLAESAFGKRPQGSVKVLVIRGLVGWPDATKSTNLERNLVLVREIIRMAYSQRRLVVLDPSYVWPAPWQLQFQWPGRKTKQQSSAEILTYFRNNGFQEIDLGSPFSLVYSGEAQRESTQKALAMVKLKTRSFRQALRDIFGL